MDLFVFSNEVHSKDSFTVSNGNWEALKQRLASTGNDGATSYKNLEGYVSGGEVLLFTDGYQNMWAGAPKFKGELFIINGKKGL